VRYIERAKNNEKVALLDLIAGAGGGKPLSPLRAEKKSFSFFFFLFSL
jgi:hypothetical protein